MGLLSLKTDNNKAIPQKEVHTHKDRDYYWNIFLLSVDPVNS